MNDKGFRQGEYVLNLLAVKFSSQEVQGETLPYTTRDNLRRLQDQHAGTWLLRRAGMQVQAVPLADDAQTLSGTPTGFTTSQDWLLFGKLLEEGVRRLLKSSYPTFFVSDYGEVVLKAKGDQANIVREVLKNSPADLKKLSFLKIHRLYHFEAAYLGADENDSRAFGLRVKLSTRWEIGATITELANKGVDLTGCYVIPLAERRADIIGNKAVGAVREVREGKVYLYDARGSDVVEARDHTIVASLENVSRLIESILEGHAKRVVRSIREEVWKFLGAQSQQTRITGIAKSLAKQPIVCARELSAVIQDQLYRVGSESFRTALKLESPKYTLSYNKPPVNGPIATGLDDRGPFDRDSFKKPTPYILVITPKRWMGQVEQFLGRWRDGGLGKPYVKGFMRKYHLRGCEFHFEDFDETTSGAAADYEQACLQALRRSREHIKRYDLAVVITTEKHRLLGFNDPYLIAKAVLMNEAIPVQMLEMETIDVPTNSWPLILNNLALASYAKLGGTPWLLASSKGQGITHEVVVGLGSAVIQQSHLGQKERYVGITTLFNYDGVYLISKTTKEASFEDYPAALESALISSLDYVSKRKGWRSGDRVRLVFHTFKQLKNAEIESVKSLVGNYLRQFTVDYAFLVISDEHNWMMYEPASKGYTSSRGAVRGVQVPWRGGAVILNPREALLAITGPAEMKFPTQGTPAPLRILLHGASTFRDLRYLTEQVFNFTYMSWKTFNLSSSPVTIAYSDMIASLLGRLRHVRNWNANVLDTTELSDSLWFL